ncbi:MAG: ybhO [Verrucomicrobiaceae bacterium]|nr:ybhO [Verrucomicrobiaceae bacterium]
MNKQWHHGNLIRLLENGEEYFPSVFAAIRNAQHEIFIETFILQDDKVGRQLRTELIDAGNRGVRISITVDGFGSPGLEGDFINGITGAGVKFHIFNPGYALLGVRTNLFRRLHRKLVVVDASIAYIGGINFIEDQLTEFGPQAKRDYAIEIEGPAAKEMRDFAEQAIRRPQLNWRALSERRYQRKLKALQKISEDTNANSEQTGAHVLFVTRDNRFERTAIERYYQLAFRTARRELIVANAYFFPGYHLLRRLRQAARRGVDVSLILQGHPDIPIVKWGARLLYGYLLSAGVKIYEYYERPLHGKVAIADDDWATVGSSNLDPLSLSLNLEANVIIRDREFNRELRGRLIHLIENHCKMMALEKVPRHTWWRAVMSAAVFHFLRYFPRWADLLPTHTVTLKKVKIENRNKLDLS